MGFSWPERRGAWKACTTSSRRRGRYEELSYAFLKSCEDVHSFDTNPLYACLHESIYCNGGGPSAWAAERVFNEHRKTFSADNALGSSDPHKPVLFTGEMVFPFMFDEIAALKPFKNVADALAAKTDWPALYDVDALARCDVPWRAPASSRTCSSISNSPRRRRRGSGSGGVWSSEYCTRA